MSILTKEIKLPRLSAARRPSRPATRRSSGPRPSRARSTGGTTGLEIGATQLIAAQARTVDGRVVADRVAARALSPGLVREGVVVEPEALAVELRRLFAEHRLDRRVRVGLATPRTILRVIDLPPLEERDIRAALTMHAQDRIPMPLDKAVLDHQTVGLVDTPDGRRLRVIVVATERRSVETLLDALVRAGLRPEGIDLSVFAAMRAVGGAQVPTGPVLYAQLGDLVNLAIADAGVCHFTRQAPQGLALVLDRLAEARGCAVADAHDVLMAASGPSADPPPAEMDEIGTLLARVASELGSELRAAAEFYGTQFGTPVTEGIVTGPLAPLTGFVPALADASGLALRCGEVASTGAAALGLVDPRVAPVAAGLAVERVGP